MLFNYPYDTGVSSVSAGGAQTAILFGSLSWRLSRRFTCGLRRGRAADAFASAEVGGLGGVGAEDFPALGKLATFLEALLSSGREKDLWGMLLDLQYLAVATVVRQFSSRFIVRQAVFSKGAFLVCFTGDVVRLREAWELNHVAGVRNALPRYGQVYTLKILEVFWVKAVCF